ncbi:hypothetical protein ADL28_08885 [Streptomyces violaceusniger]|uniref:DUF4097 family beta strand repeat-containing protein n=2 Tax=Streptomyces violaceusniger group TaxID=2839105 RepID=A0ABD5JK93_9ACTN|nr:DUF4097 family beta strand repeat-containing protein [Streptomyces violaceusniger]KUL64789.1 hypothetical protein ADL28_08885 [Streptomyces violaceusniger]MEE4588063.1 DUF4097 family beta strand repeat-containing protein [Streptomyces sp. DSM 41602]
MTERTFEMSTPGPVVLGLHLPMGSVDAQVIDSLRTARVVLSTDDSSGPAADAVNQARARQDGQTLALEVPELPGNVMTQTIRGNRIVQHMSVVTGSMTSVTIVNGRVIHGNGVHTTTTVSEIRARVLLPARSSLAVVSQSADAVVNGYVDRMEFRSVSGDLRLNGACELRAQTTSGDLGIVRVTDRLTARTVSGDIAVDLYSGNDADLNTTSGDVIVRAADAACGHLRAESVSGDVRVGGSRNLRVSAHSVSGDIYTR